MNELPQLSPATRIVDSVQKTLRDAIFGGSLRGGDPLSVPELARRLNVSRSPVREAVLGLVAQGLAVEHPRRGVMVATVEAQDLIAIHEIREFLEAGAARLCAERIEASGVETLRKIIDDQKHVVRDADANGYFRTNAELHRTIALSSQNYRLEQILDTLENQMRIALHRISSDQAHMREGLAEHGAIVDAIAAHKADVAEQAMRVHIANTITRSKRAMEKG